METKLSREEIDAPMRASAQPRAGDAGEGAGDKLAGRLLTATDGKGRKGVS